MALRANITTSPHAGMICTQESKTSEAVRALYGTAGATKGGSDTRGVHIRGVLWIYHAAKI